MLIQARSMKSKYKNTFLKTLQTAVNRDWGIESFQKLFSMKGAGYA
jgi:hypothetical protein